MLRSPVRRPKRLETAMARRLAWCMVVLAVLLALQPELPAQVLPQDYGYGPNFTQQYLIPPNVSSSQIIQGQVRVPYRSNAGALNVSAMPSIRQVQATDPSGKPLPPSIAAMPTVHEELEVIEDRSQLIIARQPIERMAIANPRVTEVAQFTPTEIAVIGLERGTTTLTFWFVGDPNPLIYLITVIPDPSLEDQRRLDYGKLEKKLAVLFPSSKVYLIPLSRKIIVRGQARDNEEAAQILSIVRGEFINEDGTMGGPQPDPVQGAQRQPWDQNDLYSSFIVNMLEVPGEHQLMLRVRVAELNRSELRRLGVNLDYLINGGRHIVSSAMGGVPSTLTGIFENGEIGVLVNWLASNGTAKILSEPTLTVLSGHTASFQSGAQFAVPTILGIAGGQTTEFRSTGSSLIVTPTVVDRDLIRMVIAPEFSAVNQDGAVNGIPGVDSRRVQTTVQLREGQSLVLAGLISHQASTEVTRIPILGELPLIGPKFFNAKKANQDESELLILVTPEIVRPMEPDEVPPVPGHEVTVPSDQELFTYAMTEGAPNQGVYQLAPYGRGAGYGIDIGYRVHNPEPSMPAYSPVPTNPYGFGYSQPQPMGGGGMSSPMLSPMPQSSPYPPALQTPTPAYPSAPAPNSQYYQGPMPTSPGQVPLSPIPDPSVRSTIPSQMMPSTPMPAGFSGASTGGAMFQWPWQQPSGSRNLAPSSYVAPQGDPRNGVRQMKFQTGRYR